MKTTSRKTIRRKTAIGITLGIVFGTAMGNVALGLTIGIIIGGIGVFINRQLIGKTQ